MKRVSRALLLLVLSAFVFGLLLVPAYAATTFRDIQGHWAQREIENLAARGIVKGYPDGTYQPDKAVTRAEFATLMINAMELSLLNPATPSFPDVPRGMWCYQQVETAAAYRIVIGWDGRFYPHYGITHEQAATLLVNALGKAQEAEQYRYSTTSFTDDGKISAWARGSVVEAARLGLITAYSDASFRPQAVTTRAEMAVFLIRFLYLYRPAPPQDAGPALTSARYDSRDDLLTMTFDRTIAAGSVDVTKIGIQFNDQPAVYFLDSRSKLRIGANDNVIQVAVVGLPEPPSVQKASIILNPGAVRDLNGVTNEQVSHFLQYVSYTDATKPELEWVTYDRDDNELTLGFSEPVLKNSIDLDNIQAYRLDGDGDVSIILTDLDGGRLLAPSGESGDTVTIELNGSDAYNLEYYLDRGDVYLVCSGFKDLNGNVMVDLDASLKEGVEIEEENSVGYLVLKSGSYDAGSDRLTLNFNRTVDHESVRLDRIALRFNSSGNPFWSLDKDNCVVLNSSDSSRIVINVDEDTVHEPGDVDRVWVKLDNGAVKDTYGDHNDGVIMALDVDGSGSNLPNLEDDGAIYDPADNKLLLSFEKRIKTIDLSEIKLWAEKSDGTAKWVIPLDRSITWDFDSDRNELMCRLTDDNAYQVERERQVWVRVEAGAALDYDGNRSEQQDVALIFRSGVASPVEISEAIITNYSDEFAWGDGDTITVTFSEPIRVSGLRVSDFKLENGDTQGFGTGAKISQTGDDTITIFLGDNCAITPEKLYHGLYISYSGDSVYDVSGQPVDTCSCRIEGYDSMGPKIEEVSVSVKNGDNKDAIDAGDEIILEFDELVTVTDTAYGGEVKIFDENGDYVTAEVDDDVYDYEYGSYYVKLKVTGGEISPSGWWWTDDLDIRFEQGVNYKVIIDVYGNPTPRRQTVSY